MTIWVVFVSSDRVTFLPGAFQNVNVSLNETVEAVVTRIPPDVAFITLQFHTLHRNATLSYTRVRGTGITFMHPLTAVKREEMGFTYQINDGLFVAEASFPLMFL